MQATRGIATALLTAALVAGCGDRSQSGAAPTTTPEPGATTGSPSPSPSGEPSAEPSEEPTLGCVAGVTEVGGRAAQRDPDAAMDAFCVVAELVRTQVFNRAFLPPEPPSADDYAGVRPVLTDAARARWDEAVTAWVERDARWAGDVLTRLVLHDPRQVPRRYEIDPRGSYAYETEVADPVATSGESGGLSLRVTVTSNLVLSERGDRSGRHVLLPVTRDATYTMVRGGPSDGWYLDDWQATDEYGDVRLVS